MTIYIGDNISGGGGSTTFVALTDTPASISSNVALRGVGGGGALVFKGIVSVTPPASGIYTVLPSDDTILVNAAAYSGSTTKIVTIDITAPIETLNKTLTISDVSGKLGLSESKQIIVKTVSGFSGQPGLEYVLDSEVNKSVDLFYDGVVWSITHPSPDAPKTRYLFSQDDISDKFIAYAGNNYYSIEEDTTLIVAARFTQTRGILRASGGVLLTIKFLAPDIAYIDYNPGVDTPRGTPWLATELLDNTVGTIKIVDGHVVNATGTPDDTTVFSISGCTDVKIEGMNIGNNFDYFGEISENDKLAIEDVSGVVDKNGMVFDNNSFGYLYNTDLQMRLSGTIQISGNKAQRFVCVDNHINNANGGSHAFTILDDLMASSRISFSRNNVVDSSRFFRTGTGFLGQDDFRIILRDNQSIANVDESLRLHPNALISMGNSRVQDVALPVSGTDGVNLDYINSRFNAIRPIFVFNAVQESLTDQGFSALNELKVITFGVDQNTTADPANILADGKFYINEKGLFTGEVIFNLFRSAGAQEVYWRASRYNNNVKDKYATRTAKTLASPDDGGTRNMPVRIFATGLGDDAIWTEFTGTYPAVNANLIVVDSNDVMYVTVDSGVAPFIYTSDDGGVSWTDITGGLTEPIRALKITTDNQIVAGTQTGEVFRYAGGGTWTPDGVGLPALFIKGMLIDEDGGYIYVGTNTGGIYRRPWNTTIGTPWVAVNFGIVGDGSLIRFDDIEKIGGYIFAVASGDNSQDGIYRSTDPGVGWARILSPTTVDFRSISGEGAIAYATGYGISFTIVQVYKTEDAGDTWVQLNVASLPTVPGGSGGQAIQYIPSNGHIYLALNASAYSYFSRDDGDTWTFVPTVITSSATFFLKVDDLYTTSNSPQVLKLVTDYLPIEYTYKHYCASETGGQFDLKLKTQPSTVGEDALVSAQLILFKTGEFIEDS
jgi:photosystem II stability/assembly factor-like uncharacterized protein